MPNVNTQFGGQPLIRPGAYYQDNVTATATTNPGYVPPLIFIGYGFGGAPKVPNTYDTASDLVASLRGGPAADYVPFMTNPSPQLNGAGQITFINAGSNTPATISLASSTGTPYLDLTTKDFGAPSNLMRISVAAASNGLTGARLVTIFDDYANTLVAGDNLGVPFTVAYLGAATGVTMTITKVSGLATVMTLTSSASGESVSIPLGAGQYDTVASVVAYINGTSAFSAILQNDGTLQSQYLDAAAAVSLPVPTSGVPNYVNVTSYVPDVFHWIDQYAGNFLNTPVIHTGVVTSGTTVFGIIPLTQFSGGTNVPPVLNDYAAALNVALGIPGWVVFMDSNSSGVRALGAAHATQASGIGGLRPRRYITGSSVGDTVNTSIGIAQSLDSETSTYVYPGIYRTDTNTGRNRLYGGLFVAAACAGMMCGNPVAEPLTSKALVSNGCEVNLTLSQIDALQRGGVMPIANNDASIPSVVSDLTTWQLDANPEHVFNQQIACRWYLSYLLRGAAQPYVGTIAYQGGLGIVRNAMVKALNGAIYAPNTNGVLSSWDPKSLALSYTGATQTLNIQVNVVFVGQNRFITIYVPVQPLNLTA